MDEPLWTLRELTAEVAAQLERNYQATDNGQVRAIPDERSVRYYTTLGLVDRPAAMRGRTALYGRRHLAQLVAIKRLQSLGKSLGEIQQVLPALDDATLSRVSGVVVARAKREARAATFWKDEPAAAPAALPPAPSSGFLAWSLPLAPGVTLTVTPARAPTDADADTLARAAAPLVAELARRGLIQIESDRDTVTAEEDEED
jgi:DNA-binding transcriptional MerR regulator